MPSLVDNNATTTPPKSDFKHTELGWIPKDWEMKKIEDYFDFKNGLNKGKEFFGKGIPIINYMDVFKKPFLNSQNIIGKVDLTENEIERFNVRKGDVFFTRTSETQDEIAYSSVLVEDIDNAVFSGFVLRARPNNIEKLDIGFTKYCFSTYLASWIQVLNATLLNNNLFITNIGLSNSNRFRGL